MIDLHALFAPDDIQAALDAGHLLSQTHPEFDLTIYNYSSLCQISRAWTPVTSSCRGMIVGPDGKVLARPFPKRYNHQMARFSSTPEAAAIDHEFFGTGKPEADWLAGLVAADGCIKNEKFWTITQSGDHGLELIEAVRGMINHGLSVGHYKPKRGRVAHSIYVPSAQMVADLATNYSITPRKSLTLTPPTLDESRFSNFLRGYIDGDGTVGRYSVGRCPNYLIVCLVGTEDFIESVHHLNESGRVRELKRAKNTWEIRFNGNHAVDFCRRTYAAGSDLPVTTKAKKALGAIG